MRNGVQPRPLTELPNNGIDVLLMRRTTDGTVKTSVGYRHADMSLCGWFGKRPPTHWVELPPLGFESAHLPPLNYGQCSVCRRNQIGMRHEHPCE